MKLGKISTIKIRDNVTGNEMSYMADNAPMKSTLGHCYFGTLNCKGVKLLQAQGHVVNNDKDWCSLIAKTFGLPADAVGNRGPSWRFPEDRKKYSITIDGVEYNPTITEKAMAFLEQKQEIKTEFSLGNVAKPATAVADTSGISLMATPSIVAPAIDDVAVIGRIKEFERDHTEKEILVGLTKKYGHDEAQRLWKSAHVTPAKVVKEMF